MYKFVRFLLVFLMLGFSLNAVAQGGGSNLYLVVASGGPGFTSPQEAITVLEKGILPTFDALQKMQKEGKILAAGLPAGDRAFLFIVQAASNDEVDNLIRDLPAWGALQWKVKALQSIEGRASRERQILEELKKMVK